MLLDWGDCTVADFRPHITTADSRSHSDHQPENEGGAVILAFRIAPVRLHPEEKQHRGESSFLLSFHMLLFSDYLPALRSPLRSKARVRILSRR